MAFLLGEDPVQCVFEISEDPNAVLTHSFSQILKRSRESIDGVATDNEGPTGIRREYIGLSQLAHVFRAQIESHNVRKVQQLRKVWSKIGIVQESFLVSYSIIHSCHTRCGGHHQPALLVNLVESWHLQPH